MGSKIKSVKAREILDSRGNPTLEVEIATDKGAFLAGVPSGASTGKYEAVELRDGGDRYHGKGVQKAVSNVNDIIAPKLKGENTIHQKEIDALLCELDGTENKAKLGANAIVGVSMAVCRAGAADQKLSLYKHIASISATAVINTLHMPKGAFNVVNGGAHAGNNLDVQEFMIVPQDDKFSENIQAASEIYHKLKNVLVGRYGESAKNVGDEGGFAPPAKSSQEILDCLVSASGKSRVKIILDVAASQFFRDGKYHMQAGMLSREELLDYYSEFISGYPIAGLEDPFAENDWEGFQAITRDFGKDLMVIGDDLLVTNPKRIAEAHKKNACNGLLVKLNQIGTVSETIEAVKLAQSYGWKIMVSHRSGETCDDFIADLAVGLGADYIKSGAPARGERVVKYNRLLKIEEEIRSAS